jgi:hypothetical protein
MRAVDAAFEFATEIACDCPVSDIDGIFHLLSDPPHRLL